MTALSARVDHDAFDAVDYNPVDHLNILFAQPSALASASRVSSALRTHQYDLDLEIAERTAAQRRTDADCVARIQAAQSELTSLFAMIEGVQQRALNTEQSITSMTADIKRLDMTKRNLTHSMTTLKRLQMLTSAFEQLRALKSTRQYRECAGLLAAVMQLMAHFKSYRSIAQIAELSKGVASVQRDLLEQVCEDFEIAFAKSEVQLRKDTLAEACVVADVLGDHARQRIINWYCNTQLREYRQVFRGSEEAGSLDNIGRRYSWFNRMLKTYDAEHQDLFPKEWRVNQALANVFCEGTREDYRDILQKTMRRADGQPPDINLLLSCLQETLDFENGLEKRFSSDIPRPSIDSFGGRPDGAQTFTQAISKAFEPYLSVWVESQDQQLAKLIPRYKQAPIKNPEEEYHAQTVMASSTELFNSYRVMLGQCAKLSTGTRLLELTKIFAKYLDIYCQQVLFAAIAERPGGPGMSIEDIAIVLNTTDYCFQTTTQLEERIQQRIDSDFRENVDLQAQADAFIGIASTAVRALVKKVEVDCEPAWREMRNMPWSKLQSVGDQSAYMTSLVQRLKDRSAEILALIVKQQYARAFADNLIDSIVSAYIGNIVTCRPISETAAEQMLLDLYALKSGLMFLATTPSSGGQADKGPNAAVTKRINTAMTKLDPLLKTLQVTPTPAEALVQAYLIHVHDRSEANFRKVLDIKGIRGRTEVSGLVDIFNAHKDSPSHNQPGSALVESNPTLAGINLIQSSHGHTGSGSESYQGRGPNLGLGMNLSGPSSTPSLLNPVTASAASLQTQLGQAGKAFDPAAIGERIMTAARDGVGAVERFNSPALSTSSTFTSAGGRGGTPEPGLGQGDGIEGNRLNDNLRNIGRFFRRDGGLGRRTATPSGMAPGSGEDTGRASLDRR